MTRARAAQLAWFSLLLAGVATVSLWGRGARLQAERARATVSSAAALVPIVALDGGLRGIADASGHVTPLLHYERIASGSTVADELLLALSEPERIAMLTQYGREYLPRGYLHGARASTTRTGDVEQLLAQRVDLLLLHHHGAAAELARARSVGIQVFNLGEMRGLSTLPANIEAVARLLGDEQRGVALLRSFQRRMRAVAADIPVEKRKRAVYVSAYAGQLFGGAAGTSYHDVLTSAGLIDVAAERHFGWNHYDPEQLLALDPELIVTTEPSVPQLCRIHGVDRLRACRTEGAIVGMPDALIGSPGLTMLEAAEELRDRVYGAAIGAREALPKARPAPVERPTTSRLTKPAAPP